MKMLGEINKVCTFVYITLCFVCVMSESDGICYKRILVTRYVEQTYYRTYIGKYTEKCWLGLRTCTHTTLKRYLDSRMVPQARYEEKPVCCDGYMVSDEGIYGATPVCEAICIPSCKNGICSRPGECSCYDGYIPDTTRQHACLPTCQKDCGYGTCSAPDTCDCNFGYAFQNQTCQPICNDPCLNGTCVAPDTCECWSGYRKSESNTCEPYCSRGCDHGYCVSPETCACDDGYRQEELGKCSPICPPCENGVCVAPGVCECLNDYISNGTVCEPVCSNCLNGECISPGHCECNEGYQRNSTDQCNPICTPLCGSGTCVSPGVCECYTGYYFSENNVCEPYCSDGCDKGTCVSPDVCVCDEGYQLDGSKGCVPVCSAPCGNGICVSPDVCECFPGYNLTDTGICEPLCSNGCLHGKCVSPEVCECNEGYQMNQNVNLTSLLGLSNVPLCVPDCKNCNGTCISPFNCVCDPPYEAVKMTLDGTICDCDYCSDSVKECEVTACVIKSTTLEVTTSESDYNMTTYETTDTTLVTQDTTKENYDNTERNYFDEYYHEDDALRKRKDNEHDFELSSTTDAQEVEKDASAGSVKTEKKNGYGFYWIIGLVLLCLIIIALTALLIAKRRYLSAYFKRGSYVVEENNSRDIGELKQMPGHKI